MDGIPGVTAAPGIDDKKQDGTRHKKQDAAYKTKQCTVAGYDKGLRALDVLFDGYGLRFYDADPATGNMVQVKYKGEIGSPDFEYSLMKAGNHV